MGISITEKTYPWAYKMLPLGNVIYIILHHAAVSSAAAEDIDAYHRNTNGWAGIGYHYYIRKTGEICRGRPEEMQGAHTAGFNDVALGVCFEGNFESESMNKTQLNSGIALLKELKKKYPEAIICTHRDFNKTACPGVNFPEDIIKRAFPETRYDEETYEDFKEMADRLFAEKASAPLPSWAEKEFNEAIALGITDGSSPGAFITRCEAAIMAKRAARAN